MHRLTLTAHQRPGVCPLQPEARRHRHPLARFLRYHRHRHHARSRMASGETVDRRTRRDLIDTRCLQRKHRTGFPSTDDVVNKIIRRELICSHRSCIDLRSFGTVTVQTGMVTALCAIIDMIAFLATVRPSVISGLESRT